LSIYENEVDPIFAVAGISTEVVVTRRHWEAKETLLSRDLSATDGVVVIGGDGTFSEAAQGRFQHQANG
jgi:ceramide kinase